TFTIDTLQTHLNDFPLSHIVRMLTIYIFSLYCSNKKLRTPPNYFIMNLAVSDFLMAITQSPIFFVNCMYKEWVFGETGKCSFFRLTLITSCDVCVANLLDDHHPTSSPTHPKSIGWSTSSRCQLVHVGSYFTGSTSPWGQGKLCVCTCTSVSATGVYSMICHSFSTKTPVNFPSVCFFFRDVERLGTHVRKTTLIQQQSIRTEWKLAKVAFVVIIVYVLSWSPYAFVTLIAWAGYSSILTPYSKAVPAVIAKASAIYNPIIYAIIHSKYRNTLAEKIPCLYFMAKQPRKECISISNSESSFRESMLSRQSSGSKAKFQRVSSMSTGDTVIHILLPLPVMVSASASLQLVQKCTCKACPNIHF
uniref:Opsin 4xa n=1 Tax=Astyanax mexicanus TaxID=7994 RepID=A0A8B9HHD1_ASTMX